MRITIDVDGVLADFVLGFTTVAHRMFGSPVHTTCDQPTWDFKNGLDDAQYRAVWNTIENSQTFWEELTPVASPGELRQLSALSDAHEIYFATDRRGVRPKAQTEAWLRRYGIALPTVIVTPNKGEIARAIRATALIDDKAGNAVFTAYHSPDTDTYLVDRPYNRFDHAVLGRRVVRVLTLGDAMDRIGA
jgi:hypothetical protein